MDTIIIGPFRYTVLKREKHRWLVSWIERGGIERETWLIVKHPTLMREAA